jgi:hypothetical protein
MKQSIAGLYLIILLMIAPPGYSEQILLDEDGFYQGRINDSGMVFNRSGYYRGQVDRGTFFDEQGNYSGFMRNNQLFDQNGNYWGRIDPNGNVYNQDGYFHGQVKSD